LKASKTGQENMTANFFVLWDLLLLCCICVCVYTPAFWINPLLLSSSLFCSEDGSRCIITPDRIVILTFTAMRS